MNDATKIVVETIEWKSPQYEAELQLRDEVLRKPLRLNLYDQDLESEKEYLRAGAFFDKKLVGVLLMIPSEQKTVQMKQMAVDPEYQKMQIGRKIMEFSERLLKDKGYCKIFMHARKYAVPFYEKLGYHIVGEEFEEVGIPHLRMEKEM